MSNHPRPTYQVERTHAASRMLDRPHLLGRAALMVAAGLVGTALLAACTSAPTPAPTQPAAAAPTAPAAKAAAPTQAAKPAAASPAAKPAAPTVAPKPAAPTQAPAKAAPKELPKVSTSSITAGVAGLILQALKTFKFDEKNGFVMDIKQMETAQAERAVLLKNVDVGSFPIPSTVRANLENFPLRVTTPMYWMHAILLVRADSPYKTWLDLKGMKVSSPGPVTGVHNAMQILSAMEGLNWDKDFQVQVIGAQPAAVSALDRKETEAMIVWPPLSSQMLLEAGKYRSLANINEEWKKRTGGDMLLAGLGMLEDWHAKNKELARDASKAIVDTNKYMLENDQAWDNPEIMKVLGAKPENLAATRTDIKKVLPSTGWNDATLKSAHLTVDKFVEVGVLKEAPKVEMFINP